MFAVRRLFVALIPDDEENEEGEKALKKRSRAGA